jgi:hypothetical protein
MKGIVVLAACLLPAAALAQQTYTNADLAKIEVPGAYTNQDLRRLAPLPVQKAPAAQVPPYVAPPPPATAYQAQYDNARAERDLLLAEIEFEKARVEFSESAFAGDATSFDVRLGYRTPAAVWIRDLERRVAIYDALLEQVSENARKAGVAIDRR